MDSKGTVTIELMDISVSVGVGTDGTPNGSDLGPEAIHDIMYQAFSTIRNDEPYKSLSIQDPIVHVYQLSDASQGHRYVIDAELDGVSVEHLLQHSVNNLKLVQYTWYDEFRRSVEDKYGDPTKRSYDGSYAEVKLYAYGVGKYDPTITPSRNVALKYSTPSRSLSMPKIDTNSVPSVTSAYTTAPMTTTITKETAKPPKLDLQSVVERFSSLSAGVTNRPIEYTDDVQQSQQRLQEHEHEHVDTDKKRSKKKSESKEDSKAQYDNFNRLLNEGSSKSSTKIDPKILAALSREFGTTDMSTLLSAYAARNDMSNAIQTLDYKKYSLLTYIPHIQQMIAEGTIRPSILRMYNHLANVAGISAIVRHHIPKLNQRLVATPCNEVELMVDIQDISVESYFDIIQEKLNIFAIAISEYPKDMQPICHFIGTLMHYRIVYDGTFDVFMVYDAKGKDFHGRWCQMSLIVFMQYLRADLEIALNSLKQYQFNQHIIDATKTVRNVLSDSKLREQLVKELQITFIDMSIRDSLDQKPILHFTDRVYDLVTKEFKEHSISYMCSRSTNMHSDIAKAFGIIDEDILDRGTPLFDAYDIEEGDFLGCMDALIDDLPEIREDIEKFKDFISTTYPVPDVLEYALKAYATCLNRTNSERIALLLLGVGNNGKTVLICILRKMLGSYSCQIDGGILTRSKPDPDRPSPVHMSMDRTNIAIVSEPDETKPINTETFKFYISHESSIEARPLYKNPMNVWIRPKLIIATNNFLQFRKTQASAVNKMIVIPHISIFQYTDTSKMITIEGTDGEEPALKYVHPIKAEYTSDEFHRKSAILLMHLCIKIHRKFNLRNIKMPPLVKSATNNFIKSSDPVSMYITSYIEITNNPSDRIAMTVLHELFEIWYKKTSPGAKSITLHDFRNRIHSRGIMTTTSGDAVAGIVLKETLMHHRNVLSHVQVNQVNMNISGTGFNNGVQSDLGVNVPVSHTSVLTNALSSLYTQNSVLTPNVSLFGGNGYQSYPSLPPPPQDSNV